ncbi:hypothetical protein HDU86_003734 [Geranomyces michiganensis]|nr:hypothetical protein HDU86_003734 [Geranomyces michiganensis]
MKISLIFMALVAAPLAALSNPVPQSVASLGAPKFPAAKAPKFPAAKAPKFPAAKAPKFPAAKARKGLPGAAAQTPASKGRKLPGAAGAAGAKGGVPSAAELQRAVNAWRADTGKVSAFLNGASKMSGPQLLRAAAKANVAEKDELVHKAVIDRHPISQTPALRKANNMLVTQKHFQQVVDALTTFPATNGAAAADRINRNRCVNVLPAIDAYLQGANSVSGGGVAQPSAVRPTACGGP